MAIAAPLALNVSPAAAAADGVGSASARGTDPTALAYLPPLVPVEAQYSAITNCDEAANTRPFIVTALGLTFRRTSTATSTCHSENGTSVNEGTGAGTTNLGPATVFWRFEESPDHVHIEVGPITVPVSNLIIDSAPPDPLFGSPGGVWVFGTLPWPAGT